MDYETVYNLELNLINDELKLINDEIKIINEEIINIKNNYNYNQKFLKEEIIIIKDILDILINKFTLHMKFNHR